MNAINAAKRLRIAASDEAEADKIKVVKAAEAEAERNYLHGKGVARSRKEVMRGMKEAVSDFQVIHRPLDDFYYVFSTFLAPCG